jgi:phage gp29-like protein
VDPASESAEDKKVAEFLEWQLKVMKFDKLSNKMLYATHYGFSVGELMFAYHEEKQCIYIESIKVRDRSRFKFNDDHELYLYENAEKKLMPENKFWVHSVGADHDDNPYGEGLAHSLYWPVFFKRNGLKFWVFYLEKYGMPTAIASLNQSQLQDPKQREQALNMLDAIQHDSGVLKPDDFIVELLEATRSGTATYDTLEKGMDAAISKIVLSQTMTTDNGSSRSQAEVHNEVKFEVVKSDADLLCESFNDQVVKVICDMNFANLKEYPKVWRRTEPEEDLNKIADRDTKIKNLGWEPTEEYMQDTYGDGFVKSQEQQPELGMPGQQPNAQDPSFSEPGKVASEGAEHRDDQQSIVDAATVLSTSYNELLKPEIQKILDFAEETGDLETMREKLFDLMDDPRQEKVDKIQRAGFAARLMGLLKGNRNA